MRLALLLALVGPILGLCWLLEGPDAVEAPRASVVPRDAPGPPTLAPRRTQRPRTVAPEAVRVSVRGHVLDAEGRPVAGALVRSHDEDGRVLGTTRTCGTGGYAFEAAAWDGTLTVDAGSRGRSRVWIEDEDRSDLRIGLVPVTTLRGRVLGVDGVFSVADARVVADTWGLGEVETTSRADGTFTLRGVPAEQTVEVFACAGAEGRSWLQTVCCGSGTLDLQLQPVRPLRGRVVTDDEGGERHGVAEVGVRAVEHDDDLPDGPAAVTDAHGRFTCHVLGVKGCLTIDSTAWHPPRGSIGFPSSGGAVFVVERRRTLRGRCLRADGAPVAGAEVWCSDRKACDPVWSAADGSFAIGRVGFLRHKTRVLTARCGVWRGTRRCNHPDADDAIVEVRMERTASVRGCVLDERGDPVRGVWACAQFAPDPVGDPEDTEFECEPTDAEGRFLIAGLVEGPCEIEVEVGGYVNPRIRVHATLSGTDLGDVVLSRLASRRGRLVDLQGEPIRGGRYEVEDEAGRWIPTARDGSFVMALPPDPDADLRFAAPGFLERGLTVEDVPSTGAWTVELTPAPTVSGRVVDARGRPVTVGRVGAEGLDHEGSGGDTLDTSGCFRIELSAPGPYRLELRAPRHLLEEDVRVHGGDEGLRIVAAARPVLTGRVLGPDGRGLAGVGVCAKNADGWRMDARRTLTRADGAFVVSGLDGTWFQVWTEGLPEGLDTPTLGEVEADGSNLVLQAERTLPITGRLLGVVDGEPGTYGVEVRSLDRRACSPGVTLQPDGTFRIGGLLSGLYEVHGWKGSLRHVTAVTEPVRVRAGSDNVLLVPRPVGVKEDDGE